MKTYTVWFKPKPKFFGHHIEIEADSENKAIQKAKGQLIAQLHTDSFNHGFETYTLDDKNRLWVDRGGQDEDTFRVTITDKTKDKTNNE